MINLNAGRETTFNNSLLRGTMLLIRGNSSFEETTSHLEEVLRLRHDNITLSELL